MKDFTDYFYSEFLSKTNVDKFLYCKKLSNEKRVTMKIGLGQFRDEVELNSMLKSDCKFEFKIEPRKGYKLVTFEVTK